MIQLHNNINTEARLVGQAANFGMEKLGPTGEGFNQDARRILVLKERSDLVGDGVGNAVNK